MYIHNPRLLEFNFLYTWSFCTIFYTIKNCLIIYLLRYPKAYFRIHCILYWLLIKCTSYRCTAWQKSIVSRGVETFNIEQRILCYGGVGILSFECLVLIHVSNCHSVIHMDSLWYDHFIPVWDWICLAIFIQATHTQ